MARSAQFALIGDGGLWHYLRAMSIRHAILGLLAEQPMHGYRIKEAFDGRVSPLWGLTTGQIYQSLAALERSVLVESRQERKGRRPARRVYSVTEAGRRELAGWLRRKPALKTRPYREELLIRLMMLREEEAPALWQSLRRQESEAATELLRIARLRNDPREKAGALDLAGLFLDGMTYHLEADIKNLRRFLGEIEEWARQRGSQVGSREGLTDEIPGAIREPVGKAIAVTPAGS